MIDVKRYEEHVKEPGKFEGCSPDVAYFYEVSLNGDGEHLADLETDGHWAAKFVVDAEEAEAFGLEIGSDYVLVEDSQGFVYSVSDYEAWVS